jgi:uncharacterized protein
VGLIFLFLGMLIGVIVIPFGFPGTFVILLSVSLYALLTDFVTIGIPFLIFLAVLTLIAETADNWLTAVGARRYGASTGSIWLSFLGGLLGAVVIGGPMAIVFGPLGPVAGGFAGAFGIVVAYELYRHGNWNEALRAGWGTFLGRMAGIVLKLVISIAMVIAVAWTVVF